VVSLDWVSLDWLKRWTLQKAFDRDASINAARLLASALRFPRINSPSESHEHARRKGKAETR